MYVLWVRIPFRLSDVERKNRSPAVIWGHCCVCWIFPSLPLSFFCPASVHRFRPVCFVPPQQLCHAEETYASISNVRSERKAPEREGADCSFLFVLRQTVFSFTFLRCGHKFFFQFQSVVSKSISTWNTGGILYCICIYSNRAKSIDKYSTACGKKIESNGYQHWLNSVHILIH